MRRTRQRFAMSATALVASLALAACGGSQGTADRADTSSESQPAQGAEQSKEQPDTELAIGDTFEYTDGVRFTVTSIKEVTPGQYDFAPEGKTPFRVSWTVENGSKATLDLDAWGYNAVGATRGGDAEFVSIEGVKTMTGRLAPGKKGEFEADYALAPSDGRKVAFDVARMDDAVDVLATPPTWTGDIEKG